MLKLAPTDTGYYRDMEIRMAAEAASGNPLIHVLWGLISLMAHMPSFIRRASSKVFSTFSDSGVSPTGNDTSGGAVPVAENANSPPGGIPKNVLAFRTITTLLARIQQEKPLEYSNIDTRAFSDANARELRLSTAFANVANTEHDVIAIATNLSLDNKLEVIASTNRDNNDELIDRLPSTSMISDVWKLLFSSNPRSDDKNGHTREDQIPYITHPVAPPGVIPGDPATLTNYIDNEWCVDCLPSRHTFTSYLIAIKIGQL